MKLLLNSTTKYFVTLSILFLGLGFQAVNAQDNWEPYGEEIIATDAIEANEAIAHFTEDGKTLKIQGTITGVCAMKGCWAQFTTDDDKVIKVKFKDHSFFIPTESAGEYMIAEGKAFKDVKDVDSEAESEIQYKYHLVADGVLLMK